MNRLYDALTSHDTLTENGALSHSTTGSACLDYFSKAGTYRGRDQQEVDNDMVKIFAEDEQLALKIVFYNRTISRDVSTYGHYEEDKMQRVKAFGAGQRDEFIKSLNWLERARPHTLRASIRFVPLFGRWSDLWYDSPATGTYNYVDPNTAYNLISYTLAGNDTDELSLLAKYLPQIRTNRKSPRQGRLNAWARGLCARLGWTERQYRKFKSHPRFTAHEFQRRMSNAWQNMDFGIVPGRALFRMINSRKNPIEAHGLMHRFTQFINSKKSLPFTGYLYELGVASRMGNNPIKKLVIDKQFESVLSLADEKLRNAGILTCLDTSGSMTWEGPADNVTVADVANSIAVYTSFFLKGYFKDMICAFDNNSKLHKLAGSFTDRYAQLPDAMGTTNFQSVIDMLVNCRHRHPEIPIEEYPQTLLVVSDMQFNGDRNSTNHEQAVQKLRNVGLGETSFIWWYVTGRGDDFTSKKNDAGVTLISGFDPNVINVILDEKKAHVKRNPHESMVAALDQPLLNSLSSVVFGE